MAGNQSKITMINDFLVGCDPEFVLLDKEGKVFNTSGIWESDGEIGWDHSGRVQELRPEPAKGTYALVRKLHTLLGSKKLETAEFKLRAGARVGDLSLGGHVHFGFPAITPVRLKWMTDPLTGGRMTTAEGGDVTSRLKEALPALDIVTGLLEHLDILPSTESANRRKGNYGKWGDFRDSNGHTEYRTMASWLYDPKVAFLCLTAAKLAASDPGGTLESLKGVTSFQGLQSWVERYKSKDINADRALERVLALGHKSLQVDPDVNFKDRWRRLGL